MPEKNRAMLRNVALLVGGITITGYCAVQLNNEPSAHFGPSDLSAQGPWVLFIFGGIATVFIACVLIALEKRSDKSENSGNDAE